MSENTQIEKREAKAAAIAMTDQGLSLKTLDDAFRFSRAVVESGLAPKGDTPSMVLIKLQAGAELGFPLMRSLTALVVVNGRLTLEGKAALALIRQAGFNPEVYSEGEGDARSGVFVCKDAGRECEIRFSLADAKKAGLAGKDSYKSYLDDMLIWKAVSRGANRYFSDVILGLDVAEHVADYTKAKGKAEQPERAALAPPSDPDPLLEAVTVNVKNAPFPPIEDSVTEHFERTGNAPAAGRLI